MMTAPCPHCGASHDISVRFTGEQVYCQCGGWFRVRFLMSGAELTKCDPPVSWPRTKKASK